MSDDNNRRCWLAETGEHYKSADRERLELSEERAEALLDEWRDELGEEGRWFGVSKMEAVSE